VSLEHDGAGHLLGADLRAPSLAQAIRTTGTIALTGCDADAAAPDAVGPLRRTTQQPEEFGVSPTPATLVLNEFSARTPVQAHADQDLHHRSSGAEQGSRS
jgi:hypothetical protein